MIIVPPQSIPLICQGIIYVALDVKAICPLNGSELSQMITQKGQ